MKIQIIGLGESATNWHEHRHEFDLSIGVNDVQKFGHSPDYLLVIDSPKRFTKERMVTILKTKAQKYITRDDQWNGILPSYEKVRMQQFTKHLKKGHVYSSKTSTFVALSLAFNLHATEVVLYGVDLTNHTVFNPGNKLQAYEIRQYTNFCRMLKDQGCQVFVSSEKSALSKILSVYEPYYSNT